MRRLKSSRSTLAPWTDQDVQARLSALEALHQESGSGPVAAAVHAAQRAHHRRIGDGLVLYAGTNVLSPTVAAAHDSALSTRPAMGWPGGKLQTAVQEFEAIEVIATTQLARSVGAQFAEVRLLTGTMANLAVYTAFCEPGDSIAVLSPEAGGHVSHHAGGSAGIRGVKTQYLPYDAAALDVDLSSIRSFLTAVRPKLVVIGGSVTLFPHEVGPLRAAVDEVDALLVYDISHTAGLVAAGEMHHPLAEGAHVVTFSTYKTYAGPAGGAAATNDPELAERISHAAYPVLTSNYDPARLGPLAIAAAEAMEQAPQWAKPTVSVAQELGACLDTLGQTVVGNERGYSRSHQVVLDVGAYGGAEPVVKRLEHNGIYASSCLLARQQRGERAEGIRLGTQEIVRRGATTAHVPALASVINDSVRADHGDLALATRVSELCASFGDDLWGRPVEPVAAHAELETEAERRC